MSPRRFLVATLACLLAGASAWAGPKEEIVTAFDQRKVGITVPEGFTFERTTSPNGLVLVKISGPKGTIDLNLVFTPDLSGGELATSARARKEFMVREFQEYVANSVEQAMQFEELDARSGAGAYCVFTDATLVGKPQLPPNEFLNVTVGVKAWPGGCVIFKLFSNDVISAEYRELLKLLRDGIQLKPVSPLL